jgi:hypothetical protein
LTPLVRVLAQRTSSSSSLTHNITAAPFSFFFAPPPAPITPVAFLPSSSSVCAEEPLLVQSFDMVPKLIEMLTNDDIPVPPRRLLEDLPWDQLEGLKDQLVREEIATTRAMLDK